jgi:methionine synthase I (cobalamin-dependent)
LDRGDIDELGRLYAALASVVDLRVIGGCCGTDHEQRRHAVRADQR